MIHDVPDVLPSWAVEWVDVLPHYVYRIYSPDGELLYIGCTKDLGTRIAQHRMYSPFGGRHLAYWTAWRYPNRPAALRAEREAIWNEEPAYNIIGQRRVVVSATEG